MELTIMEVVMSWRVGRERFAAVSYWELPMDKLNAEKLATSVFQSFIKDILGPKADKKLLGLAIRGQRHDLHGPLGVKMFRHLVDVAGGIKPAWIIQDNVRDLLKETEGYLRG